MVSFYYTPKCRAKYIANYSWQVDVWCFILLNDKVGIKKNVYIDGLVQGCSNSIVNALALPQSCT